MALIVVSTYMVRYPLGGMLWWALQWPLGLRAAGHTVYLVEKANYPDACFDPVRRQMTDDAAYGLGVVRELLAAHDLAGNHCFVDAAGVYHGLGRAAVERVFRSADAFIDVGNHGAWLPEAARGPLRVLVEGEPGYTQIRMEAALRTGGVVPGYDRYYSCGANVGTPRSTAPTAGLAWGHVFNPVMTDLLADVPRAEAFKVSTVMNWQAHDPVELDGVRYGQKDVEFEKYITLPRRCGAPMALAVAGGNVPRTRLAENGWRIEDAHAVTHSVASYLEYIRESAAEFSVCKEVFVATRSGWFSDRSAAYLACGRPVVIQDTGLSGHLPLGMGLFAVESVEEAAEAIERVRADYARHSEAARNIAREHLDAPRTLAKLVRDLGV